MKTIHLSGKHNSFRFHLFNGYSGNSFILIALLFILFSSLNAQNIGVGTNPSSRALFEVQGTSGSGNTSAVFEASYGISLQRNNAAIGFNQYRTDSTGNSKGRYLADGYAAVWSFVHVDPTLVEGLGLDIYPYGTANSELGVGKRVWTFSANARWRINSPGPASQTGLLDVGRGTSDEGSAAFRGTAYSSYFNNGPDENTFIRGGKAASNVILNDISGGKVIFGNGGTRIGLNTNYYVPVASTLEVRENVGGLRLVNQSYPSLTWEWRVPSGSPADYYLYYAGNLKNYFSYVDGSRHAVSDLRLKTNIQPLENILEKLMQLQPVTYRLNDGTGEGQPSIGFIAQAVEPLFPQLVSHDMPGQPGLLGVNYSGFGVVAVKAVQEEQAEIDRLQSLLSKVENSLKELEKKNVVKAAQQPK